MKATEKDLRFHSKELIDTVSRGEEVIITYRGKPAAKMIPVKNDVKNKKNNELFGIWKDNNKIKDVSQYIRKIRKGRFA